MYFRSPSKSYASLVRQIVALEGGNDGQSCHSLSDSVAWHHPPDAPDHPVPPVSGQRLADPPKVSSMPLMKGAASPPLAPRRLLNAASDKFPPERNKAGRGLDTELQPH